MHIRVCHVYLNALHSVLLLFPKVVRKIHFFNKVVYICLAALNCFVIFSVNADFYSLILMYQRFSLSFPVLGYYSTCLAIAIINNISLHGKILLCPSVLNTEKRCAHHLLGAQPDPTASCWCASKSF